MLLCPRSACYISSHPLHLRPAALRASVAPVWSKTRAGHASPARAAHDAARDVSVPPRRYAVVGAGFAGLAVAYHLLARGNAAQPVSVELLDAAGLGAGASGASAGLLHPYTPRGKLLWRGEECMEAALDLVAVAAAAARPHAEIRQDDSPAGVDGGPAAEPFVWRQPILRPAVTAKQARDHGRQRSVGPGGSFGAEPVTMDQMAVMVPGLDAAHFRRLQIDRRLAEEQKQPEPARELVGVAAGSARSSWRREVHSEAASRSHRMPAKAPPLGPQPFAGLLVLGGLVLHPQRYLIALWEACGQLAAATGGAATFTLGTVASLEELERSRGPLDGIVVAAGAAMGTIPETSSLFPMELAQGFTVDMAPPAGGDAFPDGAPSLLGPTYLAAQGRQHLVVGATKRTGLSPEDALKACGRSVEDPSDLAEARQALLPPGCELWPPLSGWRVTGVRSGVRALPCRTPQGAMPYAGRVDGGDTERRWWAVTGLGARGLVYHAWLGAVLAEAVFTDDESILAPELLRWQPESEEEE